jgi:uncharacterized protein YhaN
MTESPRWERESQEPLGPPPAPEPDETTEFDMAAAGLVDPEEERRTRLAAARESLSGSLGASRESLTATRESLSTTAVKVGRWFAALDRRPEFDPDDGRDPIAELSPGPSMLASPPEYGIPRDPEPRDAEPRDPGPRAEDAAEPERPDDTGHGRFPTAALGYNRQAVERHVAELEAEIDALRVRLGEPVSISEEIERLGEQTSAILVVAHDKASETSRRAQEHAARAVSDAARDAERITAEAERRLRELDEETDAVWRERERLLDDVRVVAGALASLADDASERFPAAEPVAVATELASEPEPASV